MEDVLFENLDVDGANIGCCRSHKPGHSKYFDVEVNDSTVSSSWAFEDPAAQALNAIAVGDGPSDRDGRLVDICCLEIRGFWSRPATESATGPSSSPLVRCVVVLDRQANGAQGTASDIFNDGSEPTLSMRSWERVPRYLILWDRTFALNFPILNEGAANLFSRARGRLPFHKKIVFDPPVRVWYKGSAGDVTDISTNALHVACVQERSANESDCKINYRARLMFVG